MSRFLLALGKYALVTYAAREAGVSRETVYNYRRDDPDFKRQWDDVQEAAYDRMETTAWDRALDTTDPGWDAGPSANLLKWLLATYRPKFRHDKGASVGPFYIIQVGDHPRRQIGSLDDLANLTDAELEALANNDIELVEGDDYTVNKAV